jgi:hypothetical protein
MLSGTGLPLAGGQGKSKHPYTLDSLAGIGIPRSARNDNDESPFAYNRLNFAVRGEHHGDETF